MSITHTILYKSFVKPFYRQHAGLFVFLFIILFGTVGVVDGAGLLDFHFSLIQAMLKNVFLFCLVLMLWLLYAKKTEQFFINTLRRPDFAFLQSLFLVENKKLFRMLFWIQFLLFLPVFIYILFICGAGFYLHAYLSCGIILLFAFSICLISARWYMFNILNPGRPEVLRSRIFLLKKWSLPYWTLFIRFIVKDKKLLFGGIKIYCCAILYLMVVNQTRIEYDLTMIILFFSMGILGHGLLIHQLRNLEETRLSFYRTVSCSLSKRFFQYAILYFFILLPEFVTIALVTPEYLHMGDAIFICLLCYSLLLFLNSLLFIRFFRMKDYLKIIVGIFILIYMAVLTVSIPWLCILLFLSSIAIFFGRYYQFEL